MTSDLSRSVVAIAVALRQVSVSVDFGLPTNPLPRLKRSLRARRKALRRWYARRFLAFAPADLTRSLATLGVREGDALMVHSDYDAFIGFMGRPSDVIGILQQCVTDRGLLMMPTIPFTGTAVQYVSEHPVFDVRRTPSRSGLLTELFRRSSNVVRSVHPTHAVAVWGRDADQVAAGHHAARTPCGAGSPYARLIERDGTVLLAGAGIESLTLYHTFEEVFERVLPLCPFTEREFVLISRLADGSTVQTSTRLFEPAVSRRRNLSKLVPELKATGAWREARVGGLSLVLLRAREVEAVALDLASRGVYCYE